MNKHDAALRAHYAASIAVDTSGQHIKVQVAPEWVHLGLEDKATKRDYEEEATDLFNLCIAKGYKAETLYRLQCEKLGLTPIAGDKLDKRTVLAFEVFAATCHALAPHVEIPKREKVQPIKETAFRGFARGWSDDDDFYERTTARATTERVNLRHGPNGR